MSEQQLDRFARGELPPAESRELAQKALDHPELFDELTSTAIARQALLNRSRPEKSVGSRIMPRIMWIAAAAAVAIAVISLHPWRSPQAPAPPVVISSPPVFLARSGDSKTFRGTEPESRAPRPAGLVVAIVGGVATVDLGSLDGLEKGQKLEVVRSGRTIGEIRLTTIFRERARGQTANGRAIRVNDRIRVPAAAYTRAVLDQIDAFSAAGDAGGARRIAEQASIENFDADVSRPEDLNNAGVVAELHGDRAKAIAFFERALQAPRQGDSPPDRLSVVIERNLARVKGSQ